MIRHQIVWVIPDYEIKIFFSAKKDYFKICEICIATAKFCFSGVSCARNSNVILATKQNYVPRLNP